MSERGLERWGLVSGVGICVMAGVPVALNHLVGPGDAVLGPAWAWWSTYLAYLALTLVVWEPERWRAATRAWFVVALVVLGASAVLLAAPSGWVQILVVVTAAIAAELVSPRGLAAVVGVQTAVVAAAGLMVGAAPGDLVVGAVFYLVVQVAMATVMLGLHREGRARAELAAANAELAEVNAELRATTALLGESSRQAERVRIARDLHDLVGHQLTALALELEVASHHAAPAADEHVARARGLAKELLDDVREAVGELRAQPTEQRGALESLAADLPRPSVAVDVDEGVDVDPERATALVRCAQEIVTNAARHADADRVWLDVDRVDGRVRLAGRDDGGGAEGLTPGNGLTGMRERVEQLGGWVSIDPRRGFEVVVELPVGAGRSGAPA